MCRGIDLLQGVGANRDTVASEMAAIVFASTSVHPTVDEDDELTLMVDNHFTPSAITTIHVMYALGY